MSSFRIGEALKKVERLATEPVEAAATAVEDPQPPDTAGQFPATPQAEPLPALLNGEPQPAGPDSTDTYPAELQSLLATRAADYGDGPRWEALLHNAWQLDKSLFWTLITFRAGGCQLVPHADAGWAIRFDAAKATTLQDEAGLLFASEAAYRSFAGKYLAPRRAELMKLLQWSSLGVLEEQGDMSWAWVDADRRRRAS